MFVCIWEYCFNNVESALLKIATLPLEAEGVGVEEGRYPGLHPFVRAEAEGNEVAVRHILSSLPHGTLRINIQSSRGASRHPFPHQYLLCCSIAVNIIGSDALRSACGVCGQLHLLAESRYAAICAEFPS